MVSRWLPNPPRSQTIPTWDSVYNHDIMMYFLCIYLLHGFHFQGVSYSQENEQQRRYYLDW